MPGVAARPDQAGENYKGFRTLWFADPWARFLPEFCAEDGDDDPDPPKTPRKPSTPSTTSTASTGKADPSAQTPPNVEGVEGVDAYGAGTRTEKGARITYAQTRKQAEPTLQALMDRGVLLAVDTETTGLDPRKDRIRLVQVTDGETVLLLDMFRLEPEVLRPLEAAECVFHNVQFDLGFLRAIGIRIDRASCTQLAYAALTHDPMVSLAKAVREVLGEELAKEQQVSDWSAPELTQEQLDYAAEDALVTRRLYVELAKRLKQLQSLRGYRLVRKCIPAIADAQARGVLLDTEAHGALVQEWREEKELAENRLREVLGPELNPESGKQLAGWLEENLDPGTKAAWPTTAKGQLSTDRDSLEKFSELELVRPLLEYRRVSHRLKTWGETYQRHLGEDHRLHPGFLLLGARSGRMSCRNPNVQNLPRDPKLRACFIAPEGYQLLAADFGQIELRIAGLLSSDPVIRAAYEKGRDLHRAIVSAVTGRPEDQISGEERKLGKALNFGLLYGAGAKTFRTRAQVDYGLEIPLDEAERFKRVFDQTYSRLRWWQMETEAQGKRTGYIRTPGGRRVSLRDPQDCYTDSRNYPIQSAAADLQLLAVQKVHAGLQELGLPAFLVNFVHDELVLEARADCVEEISQLLVSQMTEAFLELFTDHDPEPLSSGLVEVGTGPNYAEAK